MDRWGGRAAGDRRDVDPMTLVSFIIPTRNRPEVLAPTLNAIGSLDVEQINGRTAEVIVVDNASTPVPSVPTALHNDVPVRFISLLDNLAAASRNVAAERACGEWLVMLDDDSFPLDADFMEVLRRQAPDVGAVGAEILLPDNSHEAGGLPEVLIGCGMACRREVFSRLGGYDRSFHYYVEEYDLSARLIAAGYRIVHNFGFRVRHQKVAGGRNMDVILRNLVRNNCWTTLRYAPDGERSREILNTIRRYGRIAVKERALAGWLAGTAQFAATAFGQPRRTLARALYDRWSGLLTARRFARAFPPERMTIVSPGKGEPLIRAALLEAGHQLVEKQFAERLVIGTLSPGPMIDAWIQSNGAATPVWHPDGLNFSSVARSRAA